MSWGKPETFWKPETHHRHDRCPSNQHVLLVGGVLTWGIPPQWLRMVRQIMITQWNQNRKRYAIFNLLQLLNAFLLCCKHCFLWAAANPKIWGLLQLKESSSFQTCVQWTLAPCWMKLTHQILQAPLMCRKSLTQIQTMEQLQTAPFQSVESAWKQNFQKHSNNLKQVRHSHISSS